MIYDSFIFFNELDILELRLNVLSQYVDYFVLVESTVTFQGKSKPLFYEENKERFAKFSDKILHVIVDDTPDFSVPFDREYFQRDAILRGLKRCSPDDLIIISDVDEIPNPESIPKNLDRGVPCAFSQDLFYYQLNCKCIELEGLPWSLITRFDELTSPAGIRRQLVDMHSSILSAHGDGGLFKIIENGGWHFSYLGSPDLIVKKIEAFSHVELNHLEFKNTSSIQDAIKNGKDLFGRNLSFVRIGFESLPKYVRENEMKYRDLGYLDSTLDDSNHVVHDPKNILFDQYSRYRACAELLIRLGATPSSRILDVGSGSACLLSEFLPSFDITYVDPLIANLPNRRSNQYAFQLDEVAENLGLFDFVLTVDVLEHIPPQSRDIFLDKLTGLSKKSVILAFPYSDSEAPSTLDNDVDADYRFLNQQSYSWLEEHEKYGLPSIGEVCKKLDSLGRSTGSFFHGYSPWLAPLLSYVINLNDAPSFRQLAYNVSADFNKRFYEYDFDTPGYRAFVVGSASQLSREWLPTIKKVDGSIEREFETFMRRAFLKLVSETQKMEARIIAEKDAALAERDQIATERDAAATLLEKMQRSRSWKVTRPLRFTARVVRHGLEGEDSRKLVQGLRVTYHRLPLPAPAKKTISWAYNRIIYKPYRAFLRHSRARAQFRPPELRPVDQQRDMPDYLIWGVIDWHFRHQRPQQLAQALAATGRRVFYISAQIADDERPGFDLEPLDATGRLFQVKLYVGGAPVIYSGVPNPETVSHLRASIGELLDWANCREIVSLVQHPFWHGAATVLPNSRVVYDCMDHHEGFGNTGADILSLECALTRDADLTVTTSDWLDRIVSEHTQRRVIIRNAGDFEHFAPRPAITYRDPEGRRIIGYYGAIAEWFDQDLVEAVAKRFSDCCVLLIGADTVNAQRRLGRLPNIKFVGEVSYVDLPHYLHGFDVCILPFKVIPLTLATNPVKLYEYLSAGKPVVSVDLPEMKQAGDLVQVAENTNNFLAALEKTLSSPETSEDINRRQTFAKEQTWSHRVATLVAHAEKKDGDPKVSVVVVTYNNLDLTRACLASLDEYSDYSPLEIIVVDNASADGSKEFLSEWVTAAPNRKLILNEDNRGFAAANNQGLAIATGEYLTLLNNDTYVTPGWVRTLVKHLRQDQSIGIIGPVTNNIGNEAKINIAYKDMDEMLLTSMRYTRQHIGHTFPLHTAAFFCVMMPREVYKRIGSLDEAFGRGFFEDDDYCRRVEQMGWRVVCAEDVFIHHHLSASFNKLKSRDRQDLFERNKAVYEAKWGKWLSHSYSRQDDVAAPNVFRRARRLTGKCNVCGKDSRFFFTDASLWRESLTCEHCLTTSRYRSIARGILKAVNELTGLNAQSLNALTRTDKSSKLRVYDTQSSFYYEPCAYPLPDLLKGTGFIDVESSQYKSDRPAGERVAEGVSNQNLESLTFKDATFDIVITSDVMEHVRLDDRAHREIHRVLRPGGIYIFTVPHCRAWDQTLVRVQIVDPEDPSKDVHLLEPEYHGDANSKEGAGVLAYRTYGRDIETHLSEIGFDVEYFSEDVPGQGIMNTELYYCRKIK